MQVCTSASLQSVFVAHGNQKPQTDGLYKPKEHIIFNLKKAELYTVGR